jgi:FKBP-type peptidyl-prolyl cis-trans isomerase
MVRAMKQITVELTLRACTAWLMLAAAPLAGAQTPAAQAPAAAPPQPAPAAPPAPSPEQISYLFGLTFGEQMHRVGITDQLSLDAVARGLKDGLQGKKTAPADQQQLDAYVRSAMQSAVVRNQSAAKDFIARNGHEKGVTTTSSGLQFKILAQGDRKAAAPGPTDEVAVNYRGTLLDGTEFDSSYSRGTPSTFVVNGVIPGWQEALVLMKPGAKWQLFVPPELAYGSIPRPGIPGGSLLTFEVELLSVKANGPPAAPPGTPNPKAKPAPQSK